LFETPGQVLATVWYQGKEVIIPLVDATVVGIDGSRKTIQVRLPEGLLDVYL
jgi:16S rRNA processing protein RimM